MLLVAYAYKMIDETFPIFLMELYINQKGPQWNKFPPPLENKQKTMLLDAKGDKTIKSGGWNFFFTATHMCMQIKHPLEIWIFHCGPANYSQWFIQNGFISAMDVC